VTENARHTALITGASAGIGRAFAQELAIRGHDLVITARRQERLLSLQHDLGELGVRVESIAADLTDPVAPQRLFDAIAERNIRVDVLVNNAGYGLGEVFAKTTWPQNADFLQVMVTSVAQLTHLFVPGMIERRYGRVIHVASTAGLIHGAPSSTLYAASKAFLVRFAESLSLELEDTGVTVTAVCPGLTRSEFHDVAGTRARVQTAPSVAWMDATEVARQGVDAALAGKIVYVNGAFNRAVVAAMRALPHGLARKLMLRGAKRYRNLD
jgi:short-subunit dehydrogenase